MKENKLNQDRLKELLFYDEHTGHFTRNVTCGGQVKGSVAGRKSSAGYIDISVDNNRYKAHRLVWLYKYGVWPKDEIDHINRIKDDNRLINLREATHKLNMENMGLKKSNSSGFTGIDFHNNKWRARIQHHKKSIYIGTYENIIDAIIAREKIIKELFSYAPII